jgi:CheY-like chemotaxis protein
MENLRRLFLIDDDVDDALIFHETIKYSGLPIECFHDPDCQHALQALREKSLGMPDYIFLDLNMPRMNGVTCLIEIKKMTEYSHVPVIMYSTSASPHEIEETRQLGASYFFTKPNSIKDLKDKLLDIFSMKWK